MTKEELEKEAEEKYSEVDREFIACQDEGEVFNIGYILGAEPREKRIAELEEEKDKAWWEGFDTCKAKAGEANVKLSDEINLLKAQIEKMKNCKNCKKLKKEKDGLLFCTVGSFYTNAFGKNCDKWEIKEK